MRVSRFVRFGVFAVLVACSAGRRGGEGQPRLDGGGNGADLGTTFCLANVGRCENGLPQRCSPSGSEWIDQAPCEGDRQCSSGSCVDLCANAAENNSYQGCEYFAVTASNPSLASEFEFAVVVTNPNQVDARVTVSQGAATIGTYEVAAGAVETITLPYVDALKNAFTEDFDGTQNFHSVLATAKAYRIQSSAPVTAYQFNALDYRIARDCADEDEETAFDGECFSFTNDASLLLPVHSLTGNYTVSTYGAQRLDFSNGFQSASSSTPAFFAVVGAEEDPVSVSITFSANTAASSNGSSIRAYSAGETGTFTLARGDVLQFHTADIASCASGSPTDETPDGVEITYCRPTRNADPSGTRIRANGKVSVVGGHACAFVPYNRWACDHMEETMIPEDTWGRDFIVSVTQPLRGEPNLVRILSSTSGNSLTFDPPVHAATTLNTGDVLEFETSQSFRVQGTAAIFVTQLLVGQDYSGFGSSEAEGMGDPSLSLAVPQEQFRTEYNFLAPASYARNYVNITAPATATVRLDGNVVEGFSSVGGSGFSVARVEVTGGAHTIESTAPAGIVVYGFGSYTSYMYPGGLNLEVINVL